MPIVQDGSFFISCLHEATLHPRLYDFIDMIPDQLRKKVFFTSNLCKPLKDTAIERMACSYIHHLNVSMDSLDSDLFSALRKGGRFHISNVNIKRLSIALTSIDHAYRKATRMYHSH